MLQVLQGWGVPLFLQKFVTGLLCIKATGSVILVIINKQSDNFSSILFDAGAYMQHHPGCPAEGQSLQRGQVGYMHVISLMTHSTINARLLSTSAGWRRGVYWMLALVRRPLLCPSWSSSRPELEALQSDTCTVQGSPAVAEEQADTHSSTEGPMRCQEKCCQGPIFILQWCMVENLVIIKTSDFFLTIMK